MTLVAPKLTIQKRTNGLKKGEKGGESPRVFLSREGKNKRSSEGEGVRNRSAVIRKGPLQKLIGGGKGGYSLLEHPAIRSFDAKIQWASRGGGGQNWVKEESRKSLEREALRRPADLFSQEREEGTEHYQKVGDTQLEGPTGVADKRRIREDVGMTEALERPHILREGDKNT